VIHRDFKNIEVTEVLARPVVDGGPVGEADGGRTCHCGRAIFERAVFERGPFCIQAPDRELAVPIDLPPARRRRQV
jgi:hypothetical protein